MKIRWAMVLAPLLILGAANGSAQTQPADKAQKEKKGFTFYESFQASSNTLGQVYKLDTTAGYDLSKHFGIDVGIPVYFVKASSTTSSTGVTSHTGIGNAYVDLKFVFLNPLVNYASTLTGTAPTGDTASGLSTGRATFDWNNHFDKTVLGITPFINAGVANTVSDTHFFTRPFTSLGMVSHFEGGITRKVAPMVKIGASAYDILPTGTQKVFSKLVQRTSGTTTGRTSAGGGGFTTTSQTTGTEPTRDDGYSAWIAATPGPVALELGFSRSVIYNLNTVSFGIGINLSSIARKAKGR